MRIGILVPGFGLKYIDEKLIRLQPWNYLVQIALILAKQGYEVTILPLDVRISDRIEQLLAENAVKIMLPCGSPLKENEYIAIPISIALLRRLSKLLHSLKVHYHVKTVGILTTPLMSLTTLIRNYVKVKLTSTNTTASSVLLENVGFRLYGRLICKLVDKLIVPSRDYKGILEDILPCKIHIAKVLPQPTLSRAHKLVRDRNNTEIIVTYFGPFSEERGALSLIKAIRSISKHSKGNLKFVLLIRSNGDDSRKIAMLKRMITESSNVLLRIGFLSREEIEVHLALSDLVVLPYRIISSAIPLAYLEALLVNKPLVLSTNVPGVGEHLRQYIPKALRLPPSYSISELRNVMSKLIDDKRLLNNIMKRQKEYVLRLQQEINSQRIEL